MNEAERWEHPLIVELLGPQYTSGQRLPTLLEWADDGIVERDDLRIVLPLVWQHTDAPLLTFPLEELVHLFRVIGFHRDTDDASLPPEPGLTIYRGAHPIVRRGLSWTTSPEQAAWFCNYASVHAVRAIHGGQPIDRSRFAGKGSRPRVYVAHAPRDAILAIYGTREEREIIVDPRRLTGFRVHHL